MIITLRLLGCTQSRGTYQAHWDADIDCTTFVVLPLMELFHFDGHHNPAQLVDRVYLCIRHLQQANNDLTTVLQNIINGTVNKKDLRVSRCAQTASRTTKVEILVVDFTSHIFQRGTRCYCETVV